MSKHAAPSDHPHSFFWTEVMSSVWLSKQDGTAETKHSGSTGSPPAPWPCLAQSPLLVPSDVPHL